MNMPRLVRAEFLKLRKRRGLVISTLFLTVAPMMVAYVVLAVLHATDPASYGPIGSLENFSGSMEVLTQLSAVAAILVGATLGAGDLGAGVFRELVVTGRSRLALFAARVPAGLALLVLFVGGAFAIAATAASALAGTSEAPSGSLLTHSAGWLALVTAPSFALTLGVSSLLGSRGTSIGILLGWQLIAMPLLVQFGALGAVREGLVEAATHRLAPAALVDGSVAVPMSLGVAGVVLVAWIALPLAAVLGGLALAMPEHAMGRLLDRIQGMGRDPRCRLRCRLLRAYLPHARLVPGSRGRRGACY
jgi:ABC-2 family transporter protein